MYQRIYGLETEFAIKHYPDTTGQGKNKVLSETGIFEILNSVLEELDYRCLAEHRYISSGQGYAIQRLRNNSRLERNLINTDRVFMSNGCRFYIDIGSHPEFATPECRSPREVLIYDKASERILEDLALKAEEKMHLSGLTGSLFVCKNNVDVRGNTYGCHENYLVERKRPFMDEGNFYRLLISNLIPFLVTRQIFTGSGKMMNKDHLSYQISQRSEYIDAEISSATTSRRGIINSKDEPLCNKEKFRRLHLIISDSNMSEITNFLKVGTAALVLQMTEDGVVMENLMPDDAVEAVHQVSLDLTCQKKILLRDGRTMSPLEVQYHYLEAAKKFFAGKKKKAAKDLYEVLHLWEDVLDKLDRSPEDLRDRIDWITKKWLMTRYLQKEKSSFKEIETWSTLIKKIKSYRIGSELEKRRNSSKADIMSILMRNLRQIDFLHLKKFIQSHKLDMQDYFRMHKIYHGVLKLDLKYHEIIKSRSLFYQLEQNGLVARLNGPNIDRQIEKAQRIPPSRTRAKVRGAFIDAVSRRGLKGGVRWDTLFFYNKGMKKIDIPNPFMYENKKVEDIIRDIDKVSPSLAHS